MSLEDELKHFQHLAVQRGYKPGTPEYFHFIRTARGIYDKDRETINGMNYDAY